jgi:hypothetical protein
MTDSADGSLTGFAPRFPSTDDNQKILEYCQFAVEYDSETSSTVKATLLLRAEKFGLTKLVSGEKKYQCCY